MTTKPTTESNEDGELERHYAVMRHENLRPDSIFDILTAYGRATETKLARGLGRTDCVDLILEYVKNSNLALLSRIKEHSELVIEHGTDFNDMKQYFAVPVSVIDTIKAEIEGSAE